MDVYSREWWMGWRKKHGSDGRHGGCEFAPRGAGESPVRARRCTNSRGQRLRLPQPIEFLVQCDGVPGLSSGAVFGDSGE